MRKVSRYAHKIKKFLDKSQFFYEKGYKRALNFELNGERYLGQKMSYLTIDDSSVSFGYDGKDFHFEKSDIVSFKRLRTKKYLFYVEMTKKAAKKVEKKKEEKAEKKNDKQDKPKKEDKE